MNDPRIFDAIEFAAKAHRGQVRKGTPVPYVFHPLNAGRTLIEMGCEADVVIAAFLHDTIEDTAVTREEIAALFGERVARIVEGASEADKSETWENRKRETITKLLSVELDVVLVSCADKLDNIRSIRNDLQTIGEAVWSRFKRPQDAQRWYYTELMPVFDARLSEPPYSGLARGYREETERVFGGRRHG